MVQGLRPPVKTPQLGNDAPSGIRRVLLPALQSARLHGTLPGVGSENQFVNPGLFPGPWILGGLHPVPDSA